MTETTTTIRTCDVCKAEIEKQSPFINAGTYGVHAHTTCFVKLSALETIKLLGLDEIKYMIDSDWQNATKVIYMKGGFPGSEDNYRGGIHM